MRPDPLVAFLLARIADDERDARDRAAYEQRFAADPIGQLLVDDLGLTPQGTPPGVWSGTRVLQECAAKRAVITAEVVRVDPDGVWWCRDGGPAASCPILRALAAVWADHPDHRLAWRVTR